jgi:hypothetical protein
VPRCHLVHAVSWAVVNAQLAYAFTDRTDIARVSMGQPVDAHQDLGFCTPVFQLAQLIRELFCPADIDHAPLYPTGYSLARMCSTGRAYASSSKERPGSSLRPVAGAALVGWLADFDDRGLHF